MNKVIAIIGKSGSGKDKMLNTVCYFAPYHFNKIVSFTTRPRREGEIEGKDYHFLNEEYFRLKIDSYRMLEYSNFNGWYYGVSKDSLSEDKINIGVFSPNGVRSLSENPDIDLSIIWLHTSDKERLLRQLNREKWPDIEEIIRRYQADEEDFLGLANEFSCIHLDNETQDDFLRSVNSILTTFG